MIVLDYTDRRPIYEQVVERFQSLVLRGVLEKDSLLPSVRSLAMELSINPNTIQRAYTELERRGVIYAVKGKGNFVADIQALLNLREKEVTDDVERLVHKAKEAGMSKEALEGLVDKAWQTGQQPEQTKNGLPGESPVKYAGIYENMSPVQAERRQQKEEELQKDVAENGTGGEADD
ncbi:MAG: GntR family transcriptional regulator [Lachnospiraceae bacterium]|nr:GntR family transcriptional regulator [Lachnospiraceae bacterium]